MERLEIKIGMEEREGGRDKGFIVEKKYIHGEKSRI